MAPRGLATLVFGLAALAPACATSANNGGFGGGGDAGYVPDVVIVHAGSDASDATMPGQHDVRSIFGGGDTGQGPSDAPATRDGSPGQDVASQDSAHTDGPSTATGQDGAAKDAESDRQANDSGTKDSGTKDSGTKESGANDSATKDASSCTTVNVPSGTGGAGACPAPVTGSCAPGTLAGFVPTAPPPTGASQGACTPDLIQAVYDGCLGPSSSNTACTNADPTGNCYRCIFTDQVNTSWGPIVSAGGLAQINTGGCLELLEPCNSACATAIEEDLQCEQYACGTNCPITTQASTTAYGNCANSIDSCDPNGCAAYAVGAECAGNVIGSHPGTVCFENENNFEAAFLAIAPIFCGN
jgi:hypothetical protein